jgi:sulfur dioxygenase
MVAEGTSLPHPFVRPERPGAVPVVVPPELAGMLAGSEPPFVLDVRPPSERRQARLPGDASLPIAELPARFAELPRGRPIVVYSHFGEEARRAAEFLGQQGFSSVAALEGGIDEYARTVDPTIPRYGPADGAELVLQQFPRAATGCLAYLVGDPEEREAILIDPGREIEPYLAALSAGSWHLAAIVESHTHADHLAGHAALAARTHAPIFLGRRSPALYPHRSLSEGEAVDFGRLELVVRETPGHTRDHLTLRVGDKAFTGDTLLLGSCGRTDLGDGSPDLLYESLKEKILTLPDATEVFPAHYGRHHALPERYSSTIGFERRTNEALGQGSREAFVRYMNEGWPPKPADFDRIVQENLEH